MKPFLLKYLRQFSNQYYNIVIDEHWEAISNNDSTNVVQAGGWYKSISHAPHQQQNFAIKQSLCSILSYFSFLMTWYVPLCIIEQTLQPVWIWFSVSCWTEAKRIGSDISYTIYCINYKTYVARMVNFPFWDWLLNRHHRGFQFCPCFYYSAKHFFFFMFLNFFFYNSSFIYVI